MVGSQASGWGVAKTTSTTDIEVIRATINCATQMQAQSAGMVLFLASVVTGTTHARLREILLGTFCGRREMEGYVGVDQMENQGSSEAVRSK
jgi:hypothetical protein